MSTPQEKWKRGLSKLKLSRKNSNVSVTTTSQISVMDEENDVEAYLATLKRKSGVKNLWSGHKFVEYVEGDRTPDISTDTDDELNLKLSMNLRQLDLDSDEDELRIDYMREANLNKIDENNNEISDNEPINLMQNIHFAELEIGDVELSDNITNKPDDFMPQLYTMDFNEKQESQSDSSKIILRKNIRMLDDMSSDKDDSVHSQVSSYNSKTELSIPTMSAEELIDEDASEGSSNSSKHSKSQKSDYSMSKFESVRSSPNKTKSKKSKSSRNYTLDTTESESQSDTLVSTSSISINDRKKSRKSKRSHDKIRKKHSLSTSQKHVCTQTSKKDDLTDEVSKFRYTWKQPYPSNIAVHAVDMAAMDVLTNYNPAVLAANDMLKFHLDLLKKHITDSQRLYEAYSGEDLNRNFKYTTFQDTMKYIDKNKPNVITYEEALKEVKNVDT